MQSKNSITLSINIFLLALLTVLILFFIAFTLTSCKKDTDPLPAPSILSFSPTSGYFGVGGGPGTLVTITGSNFSTVAAENIIQFNGTTSATVSAAATQLTAVVPSGATTGKITVSVNGQSTTSSGDFLVFQLPTITSFSPNSGLVGSSVKIIGTNFSETPELNKVKFNNVAATITSAAATQLTALVPPAATDGKISVEVNGQVITSTSDFIVIPPPIINSINPTHGIAGTSVVITGENFSVTPTNNTVLFNGVAATVTASSSTALSVTVPASSTTGNISVSTNGATVESSSPFEVLVDFPRNGLLAYYPFTNSLDEALHGIFNFSNIPTYRTDRFSKSTQAIDLDGKKIHSIAGTVLPDLPWTISFWINFTNLTGSHGLISTLGGSTSGIDIQLVPQGSGYVIQVWARNGPGSQQYFLTGSPTTNYLSTNSSGWINMTLSYEGTTFKIYKNGGEVFSEAATESFRVGKGDQFTLFYASGLYFTGGFDDLLIYDRILTANEILQLYQQTFSKY
jgi:hypothetical protein